MIPIYSTTVLYDAQMVQGLADYAQKFTYSIMQTWQHLTICLLYSKEAGGARLLLCLIARLHSLLIPQFASSATNLTLGMEIEK